MIMRPLHCAVACLLLASLAAARSTARRQLLEFTIADWKAEPAASCSESAMECARVTECPLGAKAEHKCVTSNYFTCACPSVAEAASKCFPGSAHVTTQRGTLAMSDLEAGDRVLAVGRDGRLQFEQVFMFSSRRPSEIATFLRIATDGGANLTVTPSHYLFAWPAANGNAAQAALASPASWPYVLPSKVSPGDLMPVADGAGGVRLARIVSVERLVDQGVYMPHTWSGAIIVDGVAATELTSIVPPTLASHRFHSAFAALMRTAFRVLPADTVAAAAKAVSSWAHGVADAATMPAAGAAAPLRAAAGVLGTCSA